MLLAGETSIEKVNKDSLKMIVYYSVKKEDVWKVNIATDLLNIKEGITEIEDFEKEDMTAFLHNICVS